MIVAAPAHGQVQAFGLGIFVPANEVHVKGSAGVVTGDNCTMKSVDHYHVRHATVDTQPLRRLSNDAKHALARLLADPTDEAAIRAFQRALPESAPDGEPRKNTTATSPLAPVCAVLVQDNVGVQIGDGATMTMQTDHVLDTTPYSLIDLLRENTELVTSFAEALRVPTSGAEMATFCRDVMRTAGDIDEWTQIANSVELDHETTLSCLFGFARVTHAEGAMIGTGNELVQQIEIDMPGIARGGLRADLEELRNLHHPAEIPAPARRTRRNVVTLADLDELDPPPQAWARGGLPEPDRLPPRHSDGPEPRFPGGFW